jgi:hypothetical protein
LDMNTAHMMHGFGGPKDIDYGRFRGLIDELELTRARGRQRKPVHAA